MDEPTFLEQGRKAVNQKLATHTTLVPPSEQRRCCEWGATMVRLPDGTDMCRPCAKIALVTRQF